MKHAQTPGSGRVYDQMTHQWVDADEAATAKPPRRVRAAPAPAPEVPSEAATQAAAPAGTDNTQSTEE